MLLTSNIDAPSDRLPYGAMLKRIFSTPDLERQQKIDLNGFIEGLLD
jgi:hypothetical protein